MVEYVRTPWRQPPRLAWIALIVALVLSMLVVLRILAVFMSVIFVALVAAAVLHHPFRWLAALLNGRRRIAACLICLALVLGLMVPSAWIAVEASRETIGFYQLSTQQLTERTLSDAIQSYQAEIDQLNQLLAAFGASITPEEIVGRITTAAAGVGHFFYRQGVSIATGLVRFVIGFLIWVLTLYFRFCIDIAFFQFRSTQQFADHIAKLDRFLLGQASHFLCFHLPGFVFYRQKDIDQADQAAPAQGAQFL